MLQCHCFASFAGGNSLKALRHFGWMNWPLAILIDMLVAGKVHLGKQGISHIL